MVHAAVGYARQCDRLSAQAVTTSIGPGATNLVTGAALATVNRLPVLLLPGDGFATRRADPVLQQLEVPYAGDVSVNDALRPVSRYFDRVTRPEALIPAALQAMRVLADPVETGAVTLALPQDVQAEAYDWPEEFFADRVWRVPRPAPDADGPRRCRTRAPRRPPAAAHRGRRCPPQRGRGRAVRLRRRHRHPRRVHPGRQGLAAPRPPRRRGRHRPHRHRHRRRPRPRGRPGPRRRHPLHRLHHRLRDPLRRSPACASSTSTSRPSTPTSSAPPVLVADARAGLEALTKELSGHRVDAEYEAAYRAAKAGWERRVDAAYAAEDASVRPSQTQVLGALDAVVDDTDVDHQRGRFPPR